MERIIKAIEKITNEVETISHLPIYHSLKPMDDTEEFIVFNYTFEESAWSNDKADAYIIDISILVSRKNSLDLLNTIKDIYENTDFDLIATGTNIDSFNQEAIMYTCYEVYNEEVCKS